MYIQIINGPNLNLLGVREPEIYGSRSFEAYLPELRQRYAAVELRYFQSNSEGALIDCVQQSGLDPECGGIVMNPGAYAHYSLALADALASVKAPAVEVHISNIHAREEFRSHSVTARSCRGMVCGLGFKGYDLAIEALTKE